jgi:hypothetical protein
LEEIDVKSRACVSLIVRLVAGVAATLLASHVDGQAPAEKLGPFPFSIQAGGGYYAARPDIGPKWKMRLNFIVLLPAGC